MIKAIIFDIGGVVTSPATFHPFARKYAKALGLKETGIYDILQKYWKLWELEKINEKEFFESVARDLKMEGHGEKIREDLYNIAKPCKGIHLLINKLRKGYKIFALTNHAREFFEFLDSRQDIENKFEKVFKSYETGFAKPDPKFFKYMLDRIGMKPEECVFIDDSEKNVKAAGMLGFKAILHKNLKQTEKELKELGVNF